jgi:hypothetical protein
MSTAACTRSDILCSPKRDDGWERFSLAARVPFFRTAPLRHCGECIEEKAGKSTLRSCEEPGILARESKLTVFDG